MSAQAEVEAEIEAAFAEAGVRGFVFAYDVDAGPGVNDERAVAVEADELVCLASVFKIPIAVAYAREAAAGRLDRAERLSVEARFRDGGIGTSGLADPVEMSLRDLVAMMLTMSDNAATDVVLERVGLDTVNGLLKELGRDRTHLIGGCAELLGSMAAELGVADVAEAEARFAELVASGDFMELSVCRPEVTTRGTARDVAGLLGQIWRDEAGPEEACAEVRAVMARQVWPHRLASGFDDAWRIGAKTGTLPGWRNEAGVVEHPDGGRFAVAVFLRTGRPGFRDPAADRVIGRAGRLAVDHLRTLIS